MTSSSTDVHGAGLVALCLLTGCTLLLGEPVPPHGSLREATDAASQRRAVGSLDPFRVREASFTMREQWEASAESADRLATAKRPSEIAFAWGALLPTCANCHVGDAPVPSQRTGHGAAFDDLFEGIRVNDANFRAGAVMALREAPDLGPNRERILDLADRLATTDDQAAHSRTLRALIQECWVCHVALQGMSEAREP